MDIADKKKQPIQRLPTQVVTAPQTPTGYAAGASLRRGAGQFADANIRAAQTVRDKVVQGADVAIGQPSRAAAQFIAGLSGMDPIKPGAAPATQAAPNPALSQAASVPQMSSAPQRLPTQVVTAQPIQRLPTQVVRLSDSKPSPPALGVVPTRVAGVSEITGNPDGSRTFTDQPDGTMAALATRGSLRSPGAVPTTERDAYLASVPDLGSGSGLARPAIQQTAGGVGPLQAARFAASDRLAAANEDPRSVAGSAARAARLKRDYAGPATAGQRVAREQAYQQQLEGIVDPSKNLAAAAADQQRVATQEAGATQRTAISADAGVTQAQLSRPRPQSQSMTLADGTMVQVGEDGVARPVTDAKGAPVRAGQQSNESTKRVQALQDTLAERTKEFLAQSGIPGQPPTMEQVMAARRQAAVAGGHPVADNPETGEALVQLNGEWVPL